MPTPHRATPPAAGPLATGDGSQAPYYLVAELDFDSLEAIAAGLQTPEGAATVADLANFAQAGVQIVFYELKDV